MSYEPYNPEVNFYPVNEPVKTGEGTPESPSPNSPATVPQTSQSNVVPTGGGSILNGGTLQSPNFVTGANGSGWKLDSNGNLECNDGNFRGDITGATGTFSGAISASNIDIGGSDSTSFHVDVDGNLWLGSDAFATAPAKISKSGQATFAGVTTLGSEADEFNSISWNASTLQVNGSYVKNQDIFGDGSDGDVTISADTSLSSDMFYNNLTINTTKTLNPNGFRIFVKGTLTINGTGKIARNGNPGGDGGDATGVNGAGVGTAGTAGAALADGSIKGALAGPAGVAGRAGVASFGTPATDGLNGVNANNGVSVAKSLVTSNGKNGKSGAQSGDSGGGGNKGQPGSVGTAGTRTGTIYNLIHNSIAAYRLFDDNGSAYLTAAPSNGGSSSGGSGPCVASSGTGSSAQSGDTGGTGAVGCNGGIVLIFARKLVIDAGAKIQANGGKGGDAGDTYPSTVSGTVAGAAGSGASAGADGGNGGVIIIVYSSITNNGTIEAAGGAPGLKGAKGTKASVGVLYTPTDGEDAVDGDTGNSGVIIYLQV